MRGASPRMTPNLLLARARSDSIFKQPALANGSAARVLCRAPGSPVFLCPLRTRGSGGVDPRKMRGRWSAAWRNHRRSAPCGACGSLTRTRAPRGAPSRCLVEAGRAFNGGRSLGVSQLLAGGLIAPGIAVCICANCLNLFARAPRSPGSRDVRIVPPAGTASGPAVTTPHESALGEPDASRIRPPQRAGISLG